ncbi:MAG: MGMT family protein [Patescibacteria group bacterium]
MSQGKVFEKIYEAVKGIPKGKVATYGQIVNQIKNEKLKMKNDKEKFKITPRVVGWVLHQNPDSENIPCHRVVDRSGRLASGFAFGGAKEQKRKLLKEGVKFKDSIHVDLNKYQ